MRKGDLIFVRGKSILSKVINKFDGEFSHVAILLSDKGENGSVLEAQSFTSSRIEPFYFEDYDVFDLGLTNEQRNQVVQLSVDLVGKHYDYSYLFSILMNKLFKRERINNPNDMICSELLVHLLIAVGWFEGNENVDEIINFTPNELYRYLQAKVNKKA